MQSFWHPQPYTAPNEVMVIGTLQSGGLFSVQVEGAQRHRTGLHLDITGTDGVLRVTNPRGFENEHDNTVEGVTGDATWFTPLPVPAEYQYLGDRRTTGLWGLGRAGLSRRSVR